MFEGIAHEALSECMRSLQSASDAIKSKKVNFFCNYVGYYQEFMGCLFALNG